MRINRLVVVGASVVVAVAIAGGLTGCASAPASLTATSGVELCLDNPHATPAGLAVKARNSSSAPLTIVSAEVGSVNAKPGRVYAIPSSGRAVELDGIAAPYSSIPGWANHETLPVKVSGGKTVKLAVFATFPSGITGAELENMVIQYRTVDGAMHSTTAHVSEKFKVKCG